MPENASDTNDFLQRHRWATHLRQDGALQRVYKLYLGRHGDVSIRYRVRAAARFVFEAERAGLLGGEGQNLMVINAGAAGMSAVLAAAHRQIPVFLRSRSGSLGRPLRGCYSRDVDPGIYFWPRGEHWKETSVPPEVPDPQGWLTEPLWWRRGCADGIAEHWQQQYDAAILKDGFERVRSCLRDEKLPDFSRKEDQDKFLPGEQTGSWGQLLERLDPGHEYPVVLFTGLPPENCEVPEHYRGPGFWENDDLARWAKAETDGEALVSGGGDGALQDFLRLACGNGTARDIYEAIFHPAQPRILEETVLGASRVATALRDMVAGGAPVEEVTPEPPVAYDIVAGGRALVADAAYTREQGDFESMPASPNEPIDLETAIAWENRHAADFERRVRRSDEELFWMEANVPAFLSKAERTERSAREDQLREYIHERYRTLVDDLVGSVSWPAVCQAIEARDLLSQALTDDGTPRHLALAFRKPYFQIVYPINQFLALLIDAYVNQMPAPRGKALIFPGLRVQKIQPENGDHHCGQAQTCFDKEHKAEFERFPEVASPPAAADLSDLRYSAVVIRHGLEEITRNHHDLPRPW